MDDPFDSWSEPEENTGDPTQEITGDPILDNFLDHINQGEDDDLDQSFPNNAYRESEDEYGHEDNGSDDGKNDDEQNNEDEYGHEDNGSDDGKNDDEQNNGHGPVRGKQFVGKQLFVGKQFASSSTRNQENEKKDQPRGTEQINDSEEESSEETEEIYNAYCDDHTAVKVKHNNTDEDYVDEIDNEYEVSVDEVSLDEHNNPKDKHKNLDRSQYDQQVSSGKTEHNTDRSQYDQQVSSGKSEHNTGRKHNTGRSQHGAKESSDDPHYKHNTSRSQYDQQVSSGNTKKVSNEYSMDEHNTGRSQEHGAKDDPHYRMALLGNFHSVTCANGTKCKEHKIIRPNKTFHKCCYCKEYMCGPDCSVSKVGFVCCHCAILNKTTELLSFDPKVEDECLVCDKKCGFFLFQNELHSNSFRLCILCLKENKHYPNFVWKKIHSAADEGTKLSINEFRKQWKEWQELKRLRQELRQEQWKEKFSVGRQQPQQQQQQLGRQQQPQPQQQQQQQQQLGRQQQPQPQQQQQLGRQQQPQQQQQLGRQQQQQQLPSRWTGQRAELLDYCSEKGIYCQFTECYSNCGFYKAKHVVTGEVLNLCEQHVKVKLGDRWIKDQTDKNPSIAAKIREPVQVSVTYPPPSEPKTNPPTQTTMAGKKQKVKALPTQLEKPPTAKKPTLKFSFKKQQALPTQQNRPPQTPPVPPARNSVVVTLEKENKMSGKKERSKAKKQRNVKKAKDLTEDEKALLRQNTFKPTHIKKDEYYSVINLCVFPGVEQKSCNADYIHCELCDGIFDFNNYTNCKTIGKHYDKCTAEFGVIFDDNNDDKYTDEAETTAAEAEMMTPEVEKTSEAKPTAKSATKNKTTAKKQLGIGTRLFKLVEKMEEKNESTKSDELLKLIESQSDELKRVKELAEQQSKEMAILKENRERELKEIEDSKKTLNTATMPTNPTNSGVFYGQQQIPILQPNLNPPFSQFGQMGQQNLNPPFGQLSHIGQQNRNPQFGQMAQQDPFAIFQQQQQQQQPAPQHPSQDLLSSFQQREQLSPQEFYELWQLYQSTKKK